MIGIYKITNKINGKIYIGQSWNVENRWEHHKRNTHNQHLLNAFTKYGINNFLFETIMFFNNGPFTQKYLDKFENYFIEQNDSMNSEKGYNKKGGGSCGKLSEETKLKISENHIGVRPNEETKLKISKTLTGKKQSEETKRKRGNKLRGRERNPLIAEKAVETRRKNGSYAISEETRKKIGEKSKGRKRSPESIEKSNAAHRGIPLSEEHKQKLREYKNKATGKKIICLETKEIFNCAYEVFVKYGFPKQNISATCRGEQKTCGGFSWNYL